MPSVQQRYFDVLMNFVGDERNPSHQMLDRLEAAIATPDQMAEYLQLLITNVAMCRYPSHQVMDRIQRMLMVAAGAGG